jgi:hypothetical protein
LLKSPPSTNHFGPLCVRPPTPTKTAPTVRSFLAFIFFFLVIVATAMPAAAQRPGSPRGEASTQISEGFGKWIVVDYGRPILRGRRGIFGVGEEYGVAANSGAPVWRAGANASTTLTSEVDLIFGETTVPAGTHTMFIDLSAEGWTLVISDHKASAGYPAEDGLWGAYGYTEDKDVVRVPMQVGADVPFAVDQFTILFSDMTESAGNINFIWDNTMAIASFTLGSF